MLCESLLRFLPSGSLLHQPYRVFRAYDIEPLGSLHNTRKIDLRRFATTQNGILYVRRPVLERIFIPTYSLPYSARTTANTMLNFLDKLKAGPRSRLAIVSAATIIVDQYQHDLCEMGIVRDPHLFQGTCSACIRDAVTAEEYVSRVFIHPEQLPSGMSTTGFLHVALDLFNPSELSTKIVDVMLC